METDAGKIASGGKWGYIGSQSKGKKETLVKVPAEGNRHGNQIVCRLPCVAVVGCGSEDP